MVLASIAGDLPAIGNVYMEFSVISINRILRYT